MITVLYSDIINRAAELAGRTRDKLPVSEATILQGFAAVTLQSVWNKAIWPELTPDPLAIAPSTNRQFSKNEGNALNGQNYATQPLVLTGLCSSTDGFTALFTGTTNHGLALNGQLINVVLSGSDFPCFNGTFTITVTGGNTFTFPIVQGVILPIPPFTATVNSTATVPPELGDMLGVYSADPTQTTRYYDIDFEEKDGGVRVESGLASVFVEFMLPRPDLMGYSGTALSNFKVPARFSNFLAMACAGLLLKSDGLEAAAGTCGGLAESILRDELNRIKPSDRRQAPRPRTAVLRPPNP